ncbi:hypothetical protein RIF29_38594 [Crotalaria pallida]|uniref:Uncharacterized protein n=1 Tax=Crotalaria pallida TaxID=3830 RepID=A0AAN9HPV2_CROPI
MVFLHSGSEIAFAVELCVPLLYSDVETSVSTDAVHLSTSSNCSRMHVINEVEYPNIGATELTLSNGMQVIFTGYAYGGLSELPESEYFFCSMGPTIVDEIGVFGYRPSVLMAMLAGKRAEVGTKVGAYMRTFPVTVLRQTSKLLCFTG